LYSRKEVSKTNIKIHVQIYKELKKILQAIIYILDKSRHQAIEDYKKRELSALEEELSPLEQAVSNIKEKAGENCDSETAITTDRLDCLDQSIKLLDKQQALGNKTIEVLDKIVNENGKFGDHELTNQFNISSEEETKLQNKFFELEIQRGQIRRQIYDTLYSSREERLSRVKYFDFLYFSLGVSTSSSFGDIIPNSTLVRMTVILQVLISVFALAWLIELIISS
jgi:hypothetical protein